MLTDGARDPAFAAECLELPGERILAEQMAVVDPDAIHMARKRLVLEVARRYRTRFEGAFRHFTVPGTYSPDAVVAGRRALRNAALAYIMAVDDSTARALTFLEFRRAENMTDAMAALACLAESAGAERDRALAMFYDKWKDEALVVDKWFRVQALSDLPGAIGRVEALLAHPAFDLRNPNRARSVLHTFALDNPVHFHAADGSGYRLIAGKIVELDRLESPDRLAAGAGLRPMEAIRRRPPGPCASRARVHPERGRPVRRCRRSGEPGARLTAPRRPPETTRAASRGPVGRPLET